MQEYSSKGELIAEIAKTANLFISEFDTTNEADKDKLITGVDRTPSQMIAYQLGWMNLIMDWERRELNGEEVVTPAPGYKWNNLGGLYNSFYETYSGCSLVELKEQFNACTRQIITWLDDLPDEELFTSGLRKWASSTPSKWPAWKWVHINTVAPFKSFRTAIRKWKKLNNG